MKLLFKYHKLVFLYFFGFISPLLLLSDLACLIKILCQEI
ncbi:hypothetical protein IMCC1989_345 [gamma proteobacterium IMCC1989]|nr:hypothetical protein IMCC1989_345 [gamma proteobacterium IMCC1989]